MLFLGGKVYKGFPMKNAFSRKLIICALAGVLGTAFIGCGDSSSSSASSEDLSENEPKEDEVLDSRDYTDSSAAGTSFRSGMGPATIIKDSVSSYSTIRFGAYEWMAENLNAFIGYSICYNDDEENCSNYGNLYRTAARKNACPYGFHMPTVGDYEYMETFAIDVTDKAFGFNPQYAGTCSGPENYPKCSGMGKFLNLMTDGDKYFSIIPSGKTEYLPMDSETYYSIRCIRYSGFVDDEKFLPACNLNLEDEEFYVANQGENFICQDGTWQRTGERDCHYSYRGHKHYVRDTLYICDGTWRPAEMDELGVACLDSIEWTVYKLNGENYVCNEDSWRRVHFPEDKIGFCKPEDKGKIDSCWVDSTMTPFYCDGDDWRKAELEDVLGECDSTRIYKLGSYMHTDYVCRPGTWDILTWQTYSELEKEIGVCIPKRQGKIDTVLKGSDTLIYTCDTAKWRAALPKDFYGDCVKKKLADTLNFRGEIYVCRDNLKWETLTYDEERFGVCTSLQMSLRDTVYDSRLGKFVYFRCDSATLDGQHLVYWKYETVGDYYECNEANRYRIIERFDGKNSFGCNKDLKWEQLTEPVASIGYCYEKIKGEIRESKDNKKYICDSTWRKATKEEVLGTCTTAREGEKVNFQSSYNLCSDGAWKTITKLEYDMGFCDNSSVGNISFDRDSIGYICKTTGWSKATVTDIFGKCQSDKAGTVVTLHTSSTGIARYVCHGSSSWTSLSSLEEDEGICTKEREGNMLFYRDTLFGCNSYNWRVVPLTEVLGPCTSTEYGKTGTIETKKYTCTANGWGAYNSLVSELGVCESSKVGTVKTYNGKTYGCGKNYHNSTTTYDWVQGSEITDSLGFCFGNNFGWGVFKGMDYGCAGHGESKWINSTFWAMYGSCVNTRYGITVGLEGQHYYCDAYLKDYSTSSKGWHKMTAMDSTVGVCREAIHLEPATYLGEHYYCGKEKCSHDSCYVWLQATTLEQTFGLCNANRKNLKGTWNGMNIVCDGTSWTRDPDDYGSFKDSRSGQIIRTVKIGENVWMVDNLNYEVSGQSWCPENATDGCDEYGRLYNWMAAMGVGEQYEKTRLVYSDSLSHQGVCPEGWHIPAASEWKTLLKDIDNGGLGFRTKMLGYHKVWYRNGIDRVDEFIADAFPKYWSASQYSDSTAFHVDFVAGKLYGYNIPKAYGYPVRCVKNSD